MGKTTVSAGKGISSMSIDLVTLEDRFGNPSRNSMQGLAGCGCGRRRRGRNENNNINVINIGGSQGSPTVTDSRSRSNLAVSRYDGGQQQQPAQQYSIAPTPQPRATTYGIAPPTPEQQPATPIATPVHVKRGYCCPLNVHVKPAFR